MIGLGPHASLDGAVSRGNSPAQHSTARDETTRNLFRVGGRVAPELKGAVDALASAAVSGADRVASAEIISSILDRDEISGPCRLFPFASRREGWDLIDRPREGHANEPLAG